MTALPNPARLLLLLTGGALAACGGAQHTADTTSAPRADAAIEQRVPTAWPYALDAEPIRAASAMVTTDDSIATAVGLDALRDGGNAIDAAVATAFALAVTYPEAGNLGGGGFLVVRLADGRTAALDFREKAPLAATADMFLGPDGEPVPGLSTASHMAAGVPGTVAGLWTAHQRFGRLPWERLVAPAIRLAEEGFPANERFARTAREDSSRFARYPASAELLLPGGRTLEVGQRWANPDLASVLRRVARHGAAGFYEGPTAELLAAEMRRGGGLITQEDLRRYRAVWREPIRFDYRSYDVVSMPPPSTGGITLALIANILEGYDLRALGWHSPQALHLTAEAMRRAFADRNHYLGDPDFVDVPRARLLSEAHAARRRSDIDPERATPSSAVTPGRGAVDVEGTETVHLSVVDAEGSAVALTTTLNDLYGSAIVVGGAGFLLSNSMNDFSAKPGAPNMYGLVEGEANAIAPGKRMLSTQTPTIIVGADGRPLLVTGARGGPRIISAVFQVISNIVDYDMDVATAVAAPRIHHQHLPDALFYERDGLTPSVVQALEALGHQVTPRGGIGNAPSILRAGDGWSGWADPRNAGTALGF